MEKEFISTLDQTNFRELGQLTADTKSCINICQCIGLDQTDIKETQTRENETSGRSFATDS
jgi:hypothetical protein